MAVTSVDRALPVSPRRAPRSARAARVATGRPAAVPELLLGLAVFGVYSLVAGLDWSGRRALALRHAHSVFGLEQRLSLDVEPTLNAWLAPHAVLRVLANYEYATTYILSALALLVWLWRCRPEVYRWARTSFVLLNLLGVACFALYPLAPPRFLPGEGFVDTVRLGHTWGSWGSPLVGHANQLAAMPSLHIGWALWVSVVLAFVSGGWRTQLLSAAHVLLTLWVIMATANHYLLDAVAAAALVALCVAVTGRRPRAVGPRVPGADAFFLHVESPAAPQHVGGVVLLDHSARPGGAPTRTEAADLVRDRLAALPRFRQQLSGGGRWRRPRWQDAQDLDWDWHVPFVDLHRPDGSPGGLRALDDLVARIAATRLPRDRPLWRLVVVHGVAPGRSAVVLVVHHVVADGIGTVGQALQLFDPALPTPSGPPGARPGALRRAGAIAVGLRELATDGRPSGSLPSSGTAGRRFATTRVPLADVRQAARRQGVRLSDLLLTAVAGGLRTVLLAQGARPPEQLRTSVPLMLRNPGSATEGNLTAAVMVDLPLGDLPEAQRLAEVARRSAPLRRPTRALAARFVMRATGEALPQRVHARFARSVYGGRFFSAIVSNMPGPDRQLSLSGAPLEAAFPLLPLAPGVPLAVGALGWNGTLCVGIAADPALVEDAQVLAEAVRDVLLALCAGPVSPRGVPLAS